jgi:hypothetical protein
MSLPGGDYLIVAVLDGQRFHEVQRHVPLPGEQIPFGYRHLKWKKNADGIIEVPTIQIPRPEITVNMGFCEGADSVVEPARSSSPNQTISAWRIPSFYIDRSELKRGSWENTDERAAKMDSAQDGDYPLMMYYKAVDLAEIQGKRLPSAAESYYVSHVLCQPADQEDLACQLKDKTFLEGIYSGAREWTTTIPGGPFSASVKPPPLMSPEVMPRMTGCANRTDEIGRGETKAGMLVSRSLDRIGIRLFRSAAARRTAKDFITPASSSPQIGANTRARSE